MTTERIQDASDPRVAAFRDVPDGERLRSQGLFVAEGRLIVARILEDARYRVRAVLMNDASYRELATAFDRLPGDVPIFVADRSAILDLTGHDLHRGCLALVERPLAASAAAVLASAETVVILEGVSNADNVGGVFRNAAAFGARRAAESGLLRSALSQGDPDVDGRGAPRAVRAVGRVALRRSPRCARPDLRWRR